MARKIKRHTFHKWIGNSDKRTYTKCKMFVSLYIDGNLANFLSLFSTLFFKKSNGFGIHD